MQKLVVATVSPKDIRCFNRLTSHYAVEWVQSLPSLLAQNSLSDTAFFISIDHPIAQKGLAGAVRQLREGNPNSPICLTANYNDSPASQIPDIIQLIQSGACEFIEIPCIKEEIDLLFERTADRQHDSEIPRPVPNNRINPTLLIIDDNIQQASQILSILPSHYRGIHAPTVESGLDAVQSQPVDFILLDIALPDLFGNHALSLFQSFSPNSVILMISAYRSIELIVETIRAGASDYLPKPIRQRHLSNRLAYHLAQSKGALSNESNIDDCIP